MVCSCGGRGLEALELLLEASATMKIIKKEKEKKSSKRDHGSGSKSSNELYPLTCERWR